MRVLWILVVAGALAVLQSLLFSLTNVRRIPLHPPLQPRDRL